VLLDLSRASRVLQVAIEPSPENAFFLTRSLIKLAKRYPEVADRVVLFPIAVGDVPMRSQILVPRDNLGNSMLPTRASAIPTSLLNDLQGARKHDVVVLPLERILPHGLGATRVVKVDTQGFECKVLQGSMSNLRHLNSRVEVLVVEVAQKHLFAHCCTPTILKHLMRVVGEPAGGPVGTRGSSGNQEPIPWLPHSNAKGLYSRPLKAAPPNSTVHAWNVSCNKMDSPGEKTCIARPWNATSGSPSAYRLWFEKPDRPVQRGQVKYYIRRSRECEEKGGMSTSSTHNGSAA